MFQADVSKLSYGAVFHQYQS